MIKIKLILITACLMIKCSAMAQNEKKVKAALSIDTSVVLKKFLGDDFEVVHGVLPTFFKADRVYMWIDNKVLDKDILQTISINKGSSRLLSDAKDRYGYAGDVVYDQVFRFSKLSEDKVGIVKPALFLSDATSASINLPLEYKLPSTLYSFQNIVQNDQGSLIDITNLYSGDSDLFALRGVSNTLKLGGYQSDRSYFNEVLGDDERMLFRSTRTYGSGPGIPLQKGAKVDPNEIRARETSWEIGSCWYILPDKALKHKFEDSRVGYFTSEIPYFDSSGNAVKPRKIVRRWSLEPNEKDIKSYLQGKLVEPKKSIVFYIDNNFPPEMVPYIIEGVNAWQASFEKIGFKNAIYALRESDFPSDKGFPWDDTRYSAISYKASTVPNAYGPMVFDPRTGEIVSAHVAIFHNVFDILQRWYFTVCSSLDTRAQKLPFDSELMGPLIRNVITHEVGHSLGLRHNFIASSHYLTDSLRNPDFVKQHGIGLSIMDYLRFNQVAQPEDNMPADLLLPKIGKYDDFAIEWGYKYKNTTMNPWEEERISQTWVSERISADPDLSYIDENILGDPSSQKEDIGKDIVKASELAVLNLKRTMSILDTVDQDINYLYTRQMYMSVLNMYKLFVDHAAKMIGGKWTGQDKREKTGSTFQAVPPQYQREALKFVKEYFIKDQDWLYPKSIQSKAKFYFEKDISSWVEEFVSGLLVKPTLITRNNQSATTDIYPLDDYLQELTEAFFDKESSGTKLSSYKRLLQQTFVNRMIALSANPANINGDVALLLKNQLKNVRLHAEEELKNQLDPVDNTHFRGIIRIIDSWIKN